MSLRIDTSQAPRTYLELHELLCAVERAAAEDESEWIEWKSVFDLNAKSTRATLARHIIGMANRRVAEAKRFVGGFGYILVGVEPGNRCGVTPVDFADLRAGIASYLGPYGPRWTGSYDADSGPPVLIIVVEPPCDGDPIYTLHKEFDKYRAGDVFVRKLASTEKADPGDLDYLTRRAALPPKPPIPRLTRRGVIAAVASAAALSVAGLEIARSGRNANTGGLPRSARIPDVGDKIWSSPVLGVSTTVPGVTPAAPVVIGHRVFVSTLYQGKYAYLYALRDSDGSRIWRLNGRGTGGFSSPAIIGEILFVGTYNGEVHAVRADDGTALWSCSFTGSMNTVPVAGNGVVYVAGSELIAFRATDGRRLWSFPAGSPEVAAGVVYAPGQDGRVYAFQAEKGTTIWKSIPVGAITIQMVAGGTLYASGSNDHIHALRASDGKLLWSFRAGGYQLTGFAADAGTVFVGTSTYYHAGVSPDAPDGYLYALRTIDGHLMWRFPAKGGVHNILAFDQVVYLGTADGQVCALEAGNGSEIWRFAPGGNWQLGPVEASSTILLSAGNTSTSYHGGISVQTPNAGHVYALRARDGKKIWDFRTGTNPGQPAAADGVVYVWCYDGNVYAIRTLNPDAAHE